jgi:hypothetical protein
VPLQAFMEALARGLSRLRAWAVCASFGRNEELGTDEAMKAGWVAL